MGSFTHYFYTLYYCKGSKDEDLEMIIVRDVNEGEEVILCCHHSID